MNSSNECPTEIPTGPSGEPSDVCFQMNDAILKRYNDILKSKDLIDSSKAAEYGYNAILSAESLGALDHDIKEELKLGANQVQIKHITIWNNRRVAEIQSKGTHYFTSLNISTNINTISELQRNPLCKEVRTKMKNEVSEFKNKGQAILLQYNNLEYKYHQ